MRHTLRWVRASRAPGMGLKLNGLVEGSDVQPGDLRGTTVALDVANLMYAFYAVQVRERDPPREVHEAAVRAAVRGTLARVLDLGEAGARSVLVLDGPPHMLKLDHLALRDEARRTPALGPKDYELVAALARALGVPVVQAPHEAEGQACVMARAGLVQVVATTDWDALAMGAPVMLRNLSASPQKTEGRRWSLVRAPAALESLGLTREMLAMAAVLMGCDYCPGFDGVGPKKAFKLLKAAPASDPLGHALAALGADESTAKLTRASYELLAEPPAAPVERLVWAMPERASFERLLRGGGMEPGHLARAPDALARFASRTTQQTFRGWES